MRTDDSRDEEKDDKKAEESPPAEDPSVEDKAAGKAKEDPVSDTGSFSSVESRNGARKRSAEHKDHREHLKIKAFKTEIEELKKDVEAAAAETARLRKDVQEAQKDALEWKDKTLRTLAEADNVRKRLEREKTEYYQFALADVFKEFLRILDNFERALLTDDTTDAFREGIALIHKQILDLLAKRGVTLIERTDRRFDPAVHQALVTEESQDIEEPMVGEELQKGYFLNDRLLRPALVKVLMPKKD